MSDEIELRTQAEFHYVKSAHHRVLHVDGAFGGPAPGGDGIAMTLYSERMPLPQREVRKIVGGSPSEVIESDSKSGIIREYESTCIISIETARALARWLDKQVELLQKAREMVNERRKGDQ